MNVLLKANRQINGVLYYNLLQVIIKNLKRIEHPFLILIAGLIFPFILLDIIQLIFINIRAMILPQKQSYFKTLRAYPSNNRNFKINQKSELM